MMEWATAFFEEKNIRSPRLSIEWLLAETLSVKRLDLYMLYDRPLSEDELNLLRPMVKRRALHEPLQYITGETEFYKATIKVEPGVLIPRPETEQLVELVLGEHGLQENLKVLDIGTGSGCIPIALKSQQPSWKVYATDISVDALGIAKKNATLNEVNITFLKDDILNPSYFEPDEFFDLIISNPPYILKEEKEILDEEVKKYEPERALFCSSTEQMYGGIQKFARQHLQQKGELYLELHEIHAEQVEKLFTEKDWQVHLEQDYDRKPRFLKASK